MLASCYYYSSKKSLPPVLETTRRLTAELLARDNMETKKNYLCLPLLILSLPLFSSWYPFPVFLWDTEQEKKTEIRLTSWHEIDDVCMWTALVDLSIRDMLLWEFWFLDVSGSPRGMWCCRAAPRLYFVDDRRRDEWVPDSEKAPRQQLWMISRLETPTVERSFWKLC